MSEGAPGEDHGRRRLADLDKRLSKARGTPEAARSQRSEEFNAASLAWRMVIELVMSIMIGCAMGWGLDTLLGTLPLFLIVFVMFGLAAGVRLMLRTAEDMNRAKPGGKKPGGARREE